MTDDARRDLFDRELRRLYDVERESAALGAALADEVLDDDLAAFYATHREDVETRLRRLDGVFEAVGLPVEPHRSPALAGLLEEREALAGAAPADLRATVDAEIGRAIERLAVTKLETLLALADRLDLGPAVTDPLATTRDEASAAVDELRARGPDR